jgi:lysophospholipase L1-like esterase
MLLGCLFLVGCAEGDLTADPDPADPDGSTPAGAAIDPDADTYVPPDYAPVAPARAIFLGDSITAGYGLRERSNGYDQLMRANNDSKWPTYVGDTLEERFGEMEVLNLAVSGATTTTLIGSQLGRVEGNLGATASGETLVFITIGGNDMVDALLAIGAGTDTDESALAIVDNLAEIASFFQDSQRFPDGVRLYITNVYEPTDGTGQVDECFFGLDLSAVQDSFDLLADESRLLAEDMGFSLVDLRGHFLGHGFRYDEEGDWYHPEDPSLWYQEDCIHPNSRGHHELRRLFLAAVDDEPLLLETP